MKTENRTPQAPGAREVPVDSTLVAVTPGQMVGRPAASPAAPAPLMRTEVAHNQSTGPNLGGRTQIHGSEMQHTLERPLDEHEALRKTQVSSPGLGPGQTAAPPPPPRIDRYAVLRTLGEGGMGVVYAAYDEELDRKIAVKVLRDAELGDASARMQREAQAMAKLSHPNVVQIHDVGAHEGQIFIAMEFVKGVTLHEWQEKVRPWQEVREMFVQAARGLAAAHREGLVHRDFKPDNVLVGEDGRARVADFGLAGAAAAAAARPSGEDSVALRVGRASAFSTSLTMAGTIMGTPAFMSPEQHQGEATDARTDQFSFCVALWSALYREAPFAGESLGELASSVCGGELREPPRSDVPAFVREALTVGLAVDPARRHPSMDALIAALTPDLTPPAPPSRWRTIGLALGGALIAGAAVFAATRERAPTPAELAAIASLAAEARAAGEEAHWVYPPQDDPKDTSILRIVALDRTEGPPERAAQAEALGLRREFAEVLVGLGDRYWDDEAGRPFARDYYSQALVFEPDNAKARERGLYTPGQLAELLRKAEGGGFSAADLAASELLAILADADPARREARLQAFVAERGSAVQRDLLVKLVGEDALGLARPEPPPEPPPRADPEQPPIVAVAPEPPEPPTSKPRVPKGGPKPDTKAAPEPEEELAQAAQDRARSDELVKEGEAARRRGDLDAAERLFNQALAAFSRNGAALMGLSDVEFDRGHFEQAVVFAERAVKAEPKKSDFRIRLGDAYFKVLRYPDARSQYEKAAEMGHPRAAARIDKVKEKLGG